MHPLSSLTIGDTVELCVTPNCESLPIADAMRCGALRCVAVRCGALRCVAVRYDAMCAVLYDTLAE